MDHIVVNYIRPEDEQGLKIYYNGVETARGNMKSIYAYKPESGRVVLGYIDDDDYYADVNLDEHLFFNETLSDQNIQDMSN